MLLMYCRQLDYSNNTVYLTVIPNAPNRARRTDSATRWRWPLSTNSVINDIYIFILTKGDCSSTSPSFTLHKMICSFGIDFSAVR